ncbi:MAG: septal ring lytic transglycosylase RlpA family protein [Gammaproteobacteria bacterium]|nr:septal ring lytic transglycosylase RlpA family protein [Gammaproteobacteria bacterium]
MATEVRTAGAIRFEPSRRPLLLLLASLLAVGCAGPTVPVVGGDAPPLVSRPGLENLPDPEPRWEPRTGAGNRSPYMVFGETYQVLPSAEGYEAEGLASWYGRKFHGRNTSNGERYDMFALTAAHKSLPLPTWVRVTNLANDRSTIVRVNDRGPFHGERLIDLSYGAAVKLGFADSGVTRVRIEAITPERPGLAASAPEAGPEDEPEPQSVAKVEAENLEAGDGSIWLQAGAFGSDDAAAALREDLLEVLGSRAGIILDRGADALTRVRIGPFPDLDEAGRVQALLTFADLVGVPLIIRERDRYIRHSSSAPPSIPWQRSPGEGVSAW